MKPVEGEIIPPDAVAFPVADLYGKFGFGDGDMLDELLGDAGFDVLADLTIAGEEGDDAVFLGHAVLAEVVRRHLAPLIPGVPLGYHISRSHNPVRADCERPDEEGRVVYVARAEILSIAREIAADHGLTIPAATGP